ncbi:MAG: HNH endonuclease family protein [Candidatus Binatus sp.]|uniref:HNH endonuclease family protein n=1 Tax=Candidatus Binatus sp. TaxID=2811406 RepID=UPI00271A333A|nr:HNH endonuclease family protein [Candidatus Binatus sp.]MDO8434884.1 HNH endonuclease family protein [Candidatus Binatus sp.]
MFHDLTMRTESELNIGRLFREFRSWYRQSGLSIEEYLASLQVVSEHFSQLLTPSGTARLILFAERLRSLDTSTVYPILLLLLDAPSTKLTTQDRNQIVQDLESFLIHRFVCQLTAKNYNHFFLGLLRTIKKSIQENGNTAAAVRNELLRSAEPTSKWPTDEEFHVGWMQNPLYVKSRVDRVAMILRAVNESLRTTKTEAIPTPIGLTVEHLMPQSAAEGDNPNYPLSGDLESDLEFAELKRLRKQMIHTVGNLTLLTGPLNSSVSDGPFSDKARAIVEHSDLRLNAFLRNRAYSQWREIDLVTRGEILFKRALEIWPRNCLANDLTRTSPSDTLSSWDEKAVPLKDETLSDRTDNSDRGIAQSRTVADEQEIVWSGEMNRRPDYFQGIILKSDHVRLLVAPPDRPGSRGQSLDRKANAYVKDPLSVVEYLKRGLRKDDLAWDYQRNFISITNLHGIEIREDPARFPQSQA